jgi:hypothetical protein
MEKGINRDRKCQDLLCLIIFISFLGGMVACVAYGFVKGDPVKMMAPYDSLGNFCGIDNRPSGLDCT